ncbi:MAG: tetratricopeptide repeat protein [Sedimentisphaerales bacterium]|nr:tetratricopeptide repeat protein [Sedimentisphaerales bacterium]
MSGPKTSAILVSLSFPFAALGLIAGCAPKQPPGDVYLDAVMLRELGQDELAVAKLNAVVAADPDFALAYSELGKAHQKLGNREKALAAFRKAAALNPWSFENHMNLAAACKRLDHYPEAADAYARAADLDPKSLDARIGAAECYLKAGHHVKSLVYCEQAEQTGERTEEVLHLLARVYEGQKDYEQAIQVYMRLLSLNDGDVDAMLALAVAHMKVGRYDKAKDVLISAAQLRPADGAAFRHLGYCLIRLGDIDQAVQMYQKSINFDKSDWEAYRGLGVAYMIKARRTADPRLQAEAIKLWRRSLSIAPQQPKHEVLEQLIREQSKLENPLRGLSY